MASGTLALLQPTLRRAAGTHLQPLSVPLHTHAAACGPVGVQKHGIIIADGPPVVGFCFSFAVEQDSLDSGKLLGWTKGFDVDGVIGKDVVQLMSGQLRIGAS